MDGVHRGSLRDDGDQLLVWYVAHLLAVGVEEEDPVGEFFEPFDREGALFVGVPVGRVDNFHGRTSRPQLAARTTLRGQLLFDLLASHPLLFVPAGPLAATFCLGHRHGRYGGQVLRCGR